MKWFVIVWAVGTGIDGPFDTQAECEAALAKSEPTIGDPGIYNPPMVPYGLCFQGVPAPWNRK